jgi:hypothetical protein
MKAALNDLNSVVLRAINGIEAGDTKQEAVQSITSFVKKEYIPVMALKKLDQLLISEAQRLHEEYGIEFEISHDWINGKVKVNIAGINMHQ